MAPAALADLTVSGTTRWYETAFNRTWLQAYAHRNDEEARRNAPHVARWLGLVAGQRILDIGCGAGRYARAFANLGLRVTGVDLSAELLQEARERSPGLPGTPIYVRMDARFLPFVTQYEGAASLFTSLGYFEEGGQDLQILRAVRRALVPGGRFLIDYLNAPNLRATIRETSERVAGAARILEERRIQDEAPGGPVVLKRVSIVNPRTERLEASWIERVRLYTADEIDAMLEVAGLKTVGYRMGDLDGTPYSWGSPRLVRIAERPAKGK